MSVYKVGENLTLNLDERKLFKGSTELILPELSYRLLVCLVEGAPNVVSHDILLNIYGRGKSSQKTPLKNVYLALGKFWQSKKNLSLLLQSEA